MICIILSAQVSNDIAVLKIVICENTEGFLWNLINPV